MVTLIFSLERAPRQRVFCSLSSNSSRIGKNPLNGARLSFAARDRFLQAPQVKRMHSRVARIVFPSRHQIAQPQDSHGVGPERDTEGRLHPASPANGCSAAIVTRPSKLDRLLLCPWRRTASRGPGGGRDASRGGSLRPQACRRLLAALARRSTCR